MAVVPDSKDIRVANLPTDEPPKPEQAETTPTPEPTPEAQVQEPAPIPEPKKPEHPDWLRVKALELGASTDYLAAVPTEELFRQVNLEVERRARAAQAPPTPPPAPQEDDDKDLWGEGVKEDEDVAPHIARAIKTTRKENRELKKAVSDLLDKSTKAERQRFIDAVDTAVETLPEEFVEIIGKPGEMNQEQIARLNAALVQAGVENEPSAKAIKNKVATSVKKLYGGWADSIKKSKAPPPAPAKEPPKTNGKDRITEEQWGKMGSAVPTHRQENEGALTTGDLVDQFFRANNINIGD